MPTRDRLPTMRGAARRLLAVAVGAALAVTIACPTPTSASNGRRPLERLLVELWTDVLETPAADNPFATPGADDCWEIGPHDLIVSPFGSPSVDECTVRRGTPLFVILTSLECSDIEENGTTVDELSMCADGARTDNPIHELRVDRHRFPVFGVGTDAFNWTVSEGSLFEGLPKAIPGAIGTSVAFGWVTLLPPLPLGTHTLTLRVGTASSVQTITTTIIVTR